MYYFKQNGSNQYASYQHAAETFTFQGLTKIIVKRFSPLSQVYFVRKSCLRMEISLVNVESQVVGYPKIQQ